MTYFHYYATTSRNLDRVLQYGVYPIAQCAGLVIAGRMFGDEVKRNRFASDFARVVSAGAYSLLTTAFFGDESRMIDNDSRKAVAAEMGIDPEKLKFSDYKYSQNAIVEKAHRDIMRLQPYRYGTDLLFVLPTILRLGSTKLFKHEWPESEAIQKNPSEYKWYDQFLNWHNGWNMSVYAGKAMYWAGETFFVNKSGHYEVVKLLETLESAGKDVSVNDLLGVYQRARHNDRGLPMIETQAEYDALRPLLQRMADAYNKHDKNFGISEIIYLVGLNKINIHTADNKAVSQEAVEQSVKEIDKVITLGLDGIREEKKKLREMQGISDDMVIHPKSFLDRIGDRSVGVAQSMVKIFRKPHKRPEEYISVRNPGELTGFNINR